jgi:hypothetical protein
MTIKTLIFTLFVTSIIGQTYDDPIGTECDEKTKWIDWENFYHKYSVDFGTLYNVICENGTIIDFNEKLQYGWGRECNNLIDWFDWESFWGTYSQYGVIEGDYKYVLFCSRGKIVSYVSFNDYYSGENLEPPVIPSIPTNNGSSTGNNKPDLISDGNFLIINSSVIIGLLVLNIFYFIL